jgi:hypothetical protein
MTRAFPSTVISTFFIRIRRMPGEIFTLIGCPDPAGEAAIRRRRCVIFVYAAEKGNR